MQTTDFSLVLGGPLYQSGGGGIWPEMRLQLLRRRIVVVTVLAWLPLLVLSLAEGHAWGTSVALPFLYDVELHARLLLAMPLFSSPNSSCTGAWGPWCTVPRARLDPGRRAAGKFDAAIASAMRLRNSILGRGPAHRVRLRCWRRFPLADADRA